MPNYPWQYVQGSSGERRLRLDSAEPLASSWLTTTGRETIRGSETCLSIAVSAGCREGITSSGVETFRRSGDLTYMYRSA